MRILMYLFISLAVTSVWAQKEYQPAATPVIVDGSDEEWSVGEHMYERESQVTYAFRKDEEKLYFLVRTNYRPTMARIMFGGLEIWAHPEGKKRRTHGLMYPMAMERNPGQFSQGQGLDPSTFKQENWTNIQLTNLFGDNRGPIQADLKQLDQPIDVQFQLHEDGYWVYELSIPISAFPEPKKNKKGIWQIGITTPESDLPNNVGGGGMPGSRMDQLPGGSLGSPGGLGAGGGMGPPVGGGPPKGIRLWTKVAM